MQEEKIRLVKASWRKLKNIDPHLLGDTFYSKLFADHPSARRIFKGPMETHYERTYALINLLITRLERIDELDLEFIYIIEEHKKIGLKPEHYQWMGSAFIWTIAQGYGTEWNTNLQSAWQDFVSKLNASLNKALAVM